jgi:hypothetical protein
MCGMGCVLSMHQKERRSLGCALSTGKYGNKVFGVEERSIQIVESETPVTIVVI